MFTTRPAEATISMVVPMTSGGSIRRITASNKIQPTISSNDKPLTNAAMICTRW